MNSVIENYRKMKQPSAVRVCNATLKKLIGFIGRDKMDFNQLTPVWLKEFEGYLKEQLADNSISTYLRMLQATYNKAVYLGLTPFKPYLFKKLAKGRAPSGSRALTQQEFRAVAAQASPETAPEAAPRTSSKAAPEATRTCDFFLLMFYLRGIPFVDLVHLRRIDLQGNLLTYRRHKTGKQMVVAVEPRAMEIIERYRNTDSKTPYLFPFLKQGGKDKFLQYESALRQFNNQLHQVGELQGVSIPLTSYCARHTWASFANFCHFDKKLISEGMGHSSVQVTEIYFKPHEIDDVKDMNQQIINYALIGGERSLKRRKKLIIK